MKSKLTKLKGTARQLDISMPKESVDEALDQVLEDIRRTASVAGFRKGKAPMDIIQKRYSDDARDEVKQRLVPRAYQAALEEHGIDPISYPELFDVSIALTGELTFKAKFDTAPEVSLKKYKGLKVKANKVKVEDKEVDETIERFRHMNAEFKDTDGPIKKGEYGICDVETFVDGKSVAKKRENMWIHADKEESLLGMGEKICGLKKGDVKEIEVTLPENYPDEKYAGKDAMFKVEVKETKTKELPALDDDFAKKIGKNTVDEVRKEVRDQLLQRKEDNDKVTMKNQIMEQLMKKHPLDLPQTMVARQYKVLMDRAEEELLRKGVDKDSIGAHQDKLKAQVTKEAENKVRLYFILHAIAEEEKVEVSEEDTDKWLNALAANYGQKLEDVKKYYAEHDLMGGLREQLREDKTLDLLLEEAVVTRK